MWARYISAFVFGSVVGSFLNVVIYRLPRGGSLFSPPSHCPFCAESIRWYDNVPIVSYFLLAGRCRHCDGRISPQYVFVEAATGALFCMVVYRLAVPEGAFPYGRVFAFCMLGAALLASTAIDLKRQIIPDEITLPGVFVGPLVALLFPLDLKPVLPSYFLAVVLQRIGWGLEGRAEALAVSVLGMAGGAAVVFASGVVGKALFRKEAMGQGDVKFMAMVGGFLGLESTILAFLLACVLGAAIGAILLVRKRQTRIPFGPYLSAATLVVMLYPRELVSLVMKYPEWLRSVMG